MPFLSRTTTTGVNGDQTYSFPFALLDESELRVVVDGTLIAADQLTVDTEAGEVTIGTGAGGHTFVGDEVVLIHRVTPAPAEDRYVQPADQGALSATALARLQLQLLYLIQELQDALGGQDANGEPTLGHGGGLVTWTSDESPPEVLADPGAEGRVLVSGPAGEAPTWETGVPTTIDVEGVTGALLTWEEDAGPLVVLEPGAADQVLTAHGAGSVLTWEDPPTAAETRSLIGYVEVRAFNLQSPEVGASEPAFFTTRAITATQITGVLIGSDTPSCTVQIRHSTDRSAAGNEVFADPVEITSTTTGTTQSSAFDDATIPANSWVWLDVTAVSGTVDWVTVELRASID